MKISALTRSPGMRRIFTRLKVLGKIGIHSKIKSYYWCSADIRVVYKCPSAVITKYIIGTRNASINDAETKKNKKTFRRKRMHSLYDKK
jgi:hypothetical protein